MKSVINLIQTPQGYSIIEGNVQVNKASSKTSKDKSYLPPKKYVQQTFTIYPYIPSKESEHHKYILLPARSLWFNINSVHDIEKKALPQWFKIKKGILATMSNIKFEKHEELYKKYRNYIIELGKEKYITPSEARKGLAGDACAIIRIHKFLEKWGLINYLHQKPNSSTQPHQNFQEKSQQQPVQRKDCFDKDKLIVPRTYGKDDLELLKKITKRFRPICQFCEGICGVSWYEYKNTIQLRQLAEVVGKQGKLLKDTENATEYKFVLCGSCFFEGSYPLILSSKDFVKQSVLDALTAEQTHQNQKKKNNEQNKVAEAIEKNKFRIKKTAEQLKMSQQYVFKILMTMPIQKLEKISRIQAETDVEVESSPPKTSTKPEKQKESTPKVTSPAESLIQRFTREVESLESEGREAYQQFFQSWLAKIHSKLQRLKDWEEGVETKFNGVIRLQKNLLASKVQALSKGLAQ